MKDHQSLSPALHSELSAHPFMSVLVVDDPSRAVACGRALLAGGVRSVELALRTVHALDCLEALVTDLPDLRVVAGTVITPEQVDEVARRGCEIAVAPGLNPRVVRHARDAGISFVPGVTTPSDIEAALEIGCTTLKFFPAEPAGGLTMLASMAGPFAHLGIDFIPLGGIRESHIPAYLGSPLVLALGGSWISPRILVDEGEWGEIERRARQATEVARGAR
ncbi:MAG: bifunctional 4-hydroxy-2-oxoglutarate aldolase/2-dehydro-3-deoxy-phosphogluconate aldolase [Spirochaetota bacterium]